MTTKSVANRIAAETIGHLETPAERAMRIAREAALIAEAEVQIAAGLGIEDDDLEVWLDALETDEDAPMPGPRLLHH